MEITVNGQKKEFKGTLPLHTIIKEFCKNSSHVIAEVNGQIVKSPNWEQTSINEGDNIELVSFVGGG